MTPEQIRHEILRLTSRVCAGRAPGLLPADHPARPAHDPAKDGVPYAARVFGPEEVEAAVGSTLDFWLTLGKEGAAMEKGLADFLGVRHVLLVNSGSSANLVAFSALTSHKLPPARRIRPGDEVITCAAGFPTTVAPIIQNGAVPVFIDNDPITGNLDPTQLELAYVPGKTKAVMVAHTLGNPFDLAAVLRFAVGTIFGWSKITATRWVRPTRCPRRWPRSLASKAIPLAFPMMASTLPVTPAPGGPLDPVLLSATPPDDGRRWGGQYRPPSAA